MGLLSSIFGRTANAGDQLAEICAVVRQQNGFLDNYVSTGKETAAALKRLEFSKDIIMVFIGVSIVESYVKSHPKALQINDAFRRRYFELVNLPTMSVIGSCLLCDDEVDEAARRIAPGMPIEKMKGCSVSTTDLTMVVGDIRSPQFRRDFLQGALMTQQRGGFLLWMPAAKSFLAQIRGVSAESISFDDANHLCIAIQMPFSMIYHNAQDLFR